MLEIKKVKDIKIPKTFLFYGKSGTGKTTLAGTFPKPLFLDVNENGTSSVRVSSKIKVTNYYDYGVIIKLHFSIPLFS